MPSKGELLEAHYKRFFDWCVDQKYVSSAELETLFSKFPINVDSITSLVERFWVPEVKAGTHAKYLDSQIAETKMLMSIMADKLGDDNLKKRADAIAKRTVTDEEKKQMLRFVVYAVNVINA